MQIKASRGLSSFSSGIVMNNSADRSLGANQKAVAAMWAGALPGSGKARRGPGDPGTEHRPEPGVAGRESRLPCRVRAPPPALPGIGTWHLPAKEMERLNRKLKPSLKRATQLPLQTARSCCREQQLGKESVVMWSAMTVNLSAPMQKLDITSDKRPVTVNISVKLTKVMFFN